ncbi:MAG: tripartite tricarboxylate transporter TctB family protein [Phreatobacter sp.]
MLLAIGVWFFVRALNLSVGTATAMGPGYYPLLASGALILLSLFVIGSAFFRPANLPKAPLRPLVSVCAAILTFALTMDFFGLMPAIFATVLVAATADRRSRPVPAIILALLLCAGAYLVFIQLLGMPMRPFKGF